jgi:ferredoxin
MKIVVDYNLCESNARCVEAAPDVFEIRDDDRMYILNENPAVDQRHAVDTAVANCPRQALRLEE